MDLVFQANRKLNLRKLWKTYISPKGPSFVKILTKLCSYLIYLLIYLVLSHLFFLRYKKNYSCSLYVLYLHCMKQKKSLCRGVYGGDCFYYCNEVILNKENKKEKVCIRTRISKRYAWDGTQIDAFSICSSMKLKQENGQKCEIEAAGAKIFYFTLCCLFV